MASDAKPKRKRHKAALKSKHKLQAQRATRSRAAARALTRIRGDVDDDIRDERQWMD